MNFDEWFEKNGELYRELTSDERYLFEAGQQSQQAKIDELQARVDEALIEMKNQLGDEDYDNLERPEYDAMLYALRNIKDILKGSQDD